MCFNFLNTGYGAERYLCRKKGKAFFHERKVEGDRSRLGRPGLSCLRGGKGSHSLSLSKRADREIKGGVTSFLRSSGG